MQFFRNQPMGFAKNAMALLELPSDSAGVANYNYLKDQMMKIPGVEAASFCLDAPASYTAKQQHFLF
jgi:putative ABC transport system permease protein